MKTNFKKISSRAAMLLVVVYMISCKKTEPVKPGGSDVVQTKEDFYAGKSVLRESISPTSFIEFHELGDEVMITIDGHLDEDPEVLAKLGAALQEKTLAGIYQKVLSSENSRISAPQILLELDTKYNTEAGGSENPAAGDAKEDEGGFTEPSPAARDWNADATWFRNLVSANSPASNEQLHIRTNYEWAWASRKGYYHVAFGMAASETQSARFRGWWENCFLFSCSWDTNFDETIKPRYWRSHSWRGSNTHRHRKFQVDGLGNDKRIHFALTWSSNLETTTPTGPAADISAHIVSFNSNALTWYVRNNGTTTISYPWIRFTYSGVPPTGGNQIDEWQIPAVLAPGNTYGDTRYANALGATVYIDSKNLIAESNELNNQVSASNFR